MYCKHCGAELINDSNFCPYCGNETNKDTGVQNNQISKSYSNDSGSFGWAILGFLIPIVGLILFAAWHTEKPLCAKKAGIGALVSFIISTILFIIYMIIVYLYIGSTIY